ncbi:hypothetical protein [Trinickia soli]|uniref:hypothetical protein n=1 Tax=Trinickia soli TaxID=380675 RepID=UPI003FA3B70B
MRRRAGAALNGLLMVVAIVALSGCERKVQLHLASDVRKASEIEAVLGSHGIDVEREAEKTGVMLYVADFEIPRAMRALHEVGLLRPDRPSVDEALGKRGIAPTPLEERARRIHSIERELEATLMDIDGVTAARVRVVPSERPSPGAPLAPASASVLLKHRAGVDLAPLMPGIARLVKNGAPGLAGEDDRRITVLLVPEQPVAPAGAVVRKGAARPTAWWVALVCAAVALGYFGERLRRRVSGLRTTGGKTAAPGNGQSARQSEDDPKGDGGGRHASAG